MTTTEQKEVEKFHNSSGYDPERDVDLQTFEAYLGRKRAVEKIAMGVGITIGCLLIGFLVMLGFSSMIMTTVP